MAPRPHFPRASRRRFAARALALAWLILLGSMTPASAQRVDPGNVDELRQATKAWQICRVERRPLVHRATAADKTARRAERLLTRATRDVSDQRATYHDLIAAAKAAKKASKAATDPVIKEKLAKLAIRKLAAADKAAAHLEVLIKRQSRAGDAEAIAVRAAKIAQRALAAKPCPKPVWSPTNFTAFNYPKAPRKATRTTIRFGVLSAIENSPPGSSIRIAVYSFVDPGITHALLKAHRRGVSVQVIASRNELTAASRSWRKLRRALGQKLLPDSARALAGKGAKAAKAEAAARASWARECVRSCRGYGGYLHSKIYLFSHVGHTRWVTMLSSANLTTFAIAAQWNHVDTVIGQSTYEEMARVFAEMVPDQPLEQPFRRFHTREVSGLVFPRPGTTVKDDPMVPILDRIECAAPAGSGVLDEVKPKRLKPSKTDAAKPAQPTKTVRRTVIRISMYAWFDPRGIQLAQLVRRKWEEGCDVKIVTGITNRRVRAALRHRGGRGPIPMRVLHREDYTGRSLFYDHSKYVAINGGYAGRGQQLVWTGSMNFTAFGFSNDEIVLRVDGRRVFNDYARNFARVWSSPLTKLPKPLRN